MSTVTTVYVRKKIPIQNEYCVQLSKITFINGFCHNRCEFELRSLLRNITRFGKCCVDPLAGKQVEQYLTLNSIFLGKSLQ